MSIYTPEEQKRLEWFEMRIELLKSLMSKAHERGNMLLKAHWYASLKATLLQYNAALNNK